MTDEKRLEYIIKQADESADLRKKVGRDLGEKLIEMADMMRGILGAGGKILICGNGGSAADSQHMAAEMIVRLTSKRNRQSLPAIALTTDTSVMTAAGNDYGFDYIFSRQVEGLGNQGDMLLTISTSGNSPNLINAAKTARERGMLIGALLGGDGGQIAPMADKSIIIPHTSVQKIQEEQIFIIHLLVEFVESDLFG